MYLACTLHLHLVSSIVNVIPSSLLNYFQVIESKAPTELIDLDPSEQEELHHLGEDAYNKSYDRLLKSMSLALIPVLLK